MHDDEVIEQAKMAQTLLEHPFFQQVVNTMLVHAADRVLASDPDKWKERDAAHRDYLAIQRLVGTLRAMAAAGQEAVQRQDAPAEPDLFEPKK